MQECIDNRGVKPFDAYDFAIPTDMCLNQRMRSCAEFSLPLEFERLLSADNLDKRFGLVVHRFPPSMTNQMFEGKNGKDKADLVIPQIRDRGIDGRSSRRRQTL